MDGLLAPCNSIQANVDGKWRLPFQSVSGHNGWWRCLLCGSSHDALPNWQTCLWITLLLVFQVETLHDHSNKVLQAWWYGLFLASSWEQTCNLKLSWLRISFLITLAALPWVTASSSKSRFPRASFHMSFIPPLKIRSVGLLSRCFCAFEKCSCQLLVNLILFTCFSVPSSFRWQTTKTENWFVLIWRDWFQIPMDSLCSLHFYKCLRFSHRLISVLSFGSAFYLNYGTNFLTRHCKWYFASDAIKSPPTILVISLVSPSS